MKRKSFCRMSLVLSCLFVFSMLASAPLVFCESENILVVGKPFGPATAFPDPAKGYNGWYTSEAGATETLFVLDTRMQLAPWLARSYRNVNPLTWEIVLKEGILFQDQTLLDADAVKWSIERIIDEKSAVFNKRIQGLLDIDSIGVADRHTVVFKTKNPNPALIYDLTSPGTGIISPASTGEKFFGTGPFVLDEAVPDEQMVLSAFDRYWGGKPGLSKAVLRIVKDPVGRMLAFESGQIDVAVNFPEHDAKRLMDRKDVRIYHKPTSRICFFFVRVADGPLADRRVRDALNCAIDREEIVNAVLAGIGGVQGISVFPETLPWYHEGLKPYTHDPDRARKLLAEAGAADSDGDGTLELGGSPLVLNMWTYEGRASLKPTLELVQMQLSKVGIGAKLRVTRKGSPINEAMQKGEVHLNLQMWNAAPQGDPDYFISNLFTSDAGFNYMGYGNSELDALARKAKTVFGFAERKRIYDRIQEIVREESPVIVLFHKSMISAVKDTVQSFRIHPAEKYLMTRELSKK